MNLLEINKEYIFVFKNENLKGSSGLFADTPTKSETLQGVVTSFGSKYVTIQTTKENDVIDLNYDTTVQIQLDELNYWFQAPEEVCRATVGFYVFSFLVTFLITLIFFGSIEYFVSGNTKLSVTLGFMFGIAVVIIFYKNEKNIEGENQ